MASQILHLDKIEFSCVNVETKVGGEFEFDPTLLQLVFDFEKIDFLTKSDIFYPDDELADPKTFVLTYGVKIGEQDAKLPYNVQVEAAAFFRYIGDSEFVGEDRFRAVRFSGYQILYGAIREMVTNITARGRYGIWHLPARNFSGVAKMRAKKDEERRQERLAKMQSGEAAPQSNEPAVKRRKRLPKE